MNDWFKLKVSNLNNYLIYRLMNEYNDFEDLLNAPREELKSKLKINDKIIDKIFNSFEKNLDKELDLIYKNKVRVLSLKDPHYPRLLKEINNPPTFLYVKGKGYFDEKSIAIVGTRRYSKYGDMATKKITKELSNNGVTIVSGIAMGIDSIAHKTAIDNNGNTIAVLGTGIDIIYPKSNETLFKRVEENGLLVSEYSFGAKPMNWHFPERNRIIAGLSKGVLIAESYKKGGALITGKIALDENRDLFAVPSYPNSPSFEGCNNLIKNSYAKLVEKGEDILTEYGWEIHDETVKLNDENLKSDQVTILSQLGCEKTLDELAAGLNYSIKDLLSIIEELEIMGIVKSLAGGRYIRKL